MVSIPQTKPSVPAALADLIAFAEAQHAPQPCIACDDDGLLYNILAPDGQEFETCTLCHGTRQIVPVASPRVSLANITAVKALLKDLVRQGGRS